MRINKPKKNNSRQSKITITLQGTYLTSTNLKSLAYLTLLIQPREFRVQNTDRSFICIRKEDLSVAGEETSRGADTCRSEGKEGNLPSRETIFVSNSSFGRRGGLERKRNGGINIPRLRIVLDVAGKPREASKWWRRNTRTPDSFRVQAQCEPRSVRVFVQPARKGGGISARGHWRWV